VLTEEGIQQVRATASLLVDRGIDAIVASDLTRTRQTADLIAEVLRLPISYDSDLRERHYGILETGPTSEVTPELMGVRDGVIFDVHAAPEGGESITQFLERTRRAVDRLRASDAQHPLIVTHGGTVRMLQAVCEGLSLTGHTWGPVTNASIWTMPLD
jgi:probable phosphoglycerate mutase